MPDKVLSQDEINAMLNAVQEGKLDLDEEKKKLETPDGVKLFDLLKQDQISHGRMPGIYMIFDRLSRYLQVNLSTSLRKSIEVNSEYASLMKYSECMNQIVNQSCFVIVRLSPLRGHSLVIFESALIYALLNSYFGGPTDGGDSGNRSGDFTQLEQRLISKFTNIVFEGLINSWAPIIELEPEIVTMETNPQFVMIVPNNEIVVNSVMQVKLDNIQGTISTIIPYSTIEPIKANLSVGFHTDQIERDDRWYNEFRDELLKVAINVKVQLGNASISMDDFSRLETGDVIVLDAPRDKGLVVEIEDQPRLVGVPIIQSNNVAVKISSMTVEQNEG